LGERILHQRAQSLGFKRTGSDVGRNGEAGLSGALAQLRVLFAAQTKGNTGVFEELLWSGRDGDDGLMRRNGSIVRGWRHGFRWIGDWVIGMVACVGAESPFVAERSDVFGE
jgi:hypothetical protein